MIGDFRNQAERIIRKWRVRSCPVPFVIWFRERTGSSHLCSILSSHPEILCRHEDFHEVTVDQLPSVPDGVQIVRLRESKACYRRMIGFESTTVNCPSRKQVISHLYDIFSCPVRACGFKLKFPTQNQLYPEIMDELAVIGPKLRIIALSRNNVVKQAVSRQNMLRIAQATDGARFNLANDVNDEVKSRLKKVAVHVDVDAVVSYARQLEHEKVGFQELTNSFEARSHNEILRVDYEDLLNNHSSTLTRILQYLDVAPSSELFSMVEKATPDRLSDAVENYDELLNAIRATELEPFL